MEEPE